MHFVIHEHIKGIWICEYEERFCPVFICCV